MQLFLSISEPETLQDASNTTKVQFSDIALENLPEKIQDLSRQQKQSPTKTWRVFLTKQETKMISKASTPIFIDTMQKSIDDGIVKIRQIWNSRLIIQYSKAENRSTKETLRTLVQKTPKIKESDVKKLYNELCGEVPFFASLSPAQVFYFIQNDLSLFKDSLTDDTLEDLIEILKISENLKKAN